MSGYTVNYEPVTQTRIAKVICDNCQGVCIYTTIISDEGQSSNVYKCTVCEMEHPNPDNVYYSIDFLTAEEK